MSRPIISLSDVRSSDDARVGGKVIPLARLVADGLPVPPGFVIPAAVFLRALNDAGLLELAQRVHREGEGPAAVALREALASLGLPSEVARAARAAARALGGPVAVRSSALDEDGGERSFAGQHESALGVLSDGVAAAVERCWRSFYAPRALKYRGTGGPAPGAMAVLVQRLVPAVAAGVLFTVNPLTGSWRELAIEAVWGLGEGLVSGQLAPHWFLMRRPRRTPRPVQRVLARVRLTMIDQDVHPQDRRWVASDDGSVRIEPVPPHLRAVPALTPSQARRIARLGLRIEARTGGALDIEWALDAAGRFWILQARPATALGDPAERPGVLWTRRFIGERLPEPVSPLGWSILEPLLSWFIGYPEVQQALLGGGPAVRLHHGRAYVNATVFRHLLFKLPGRPPPSFMLDLLPPDEAERARMRFAIVPDRQVYAALLRVSLSERRWERFAANPLTNPARWRAFEQELEGELLALAPEPADPHQAVARVEQLIDLLRTYIGIHVCSLLFASLLDQLLEGALHAAVPERAAALYPALTMTPPGNRTLEVNAALWRLAQQLSDDDLGLLAQGELPQGDVGVRLADFLDAYGHRAEASWDLAAPRWREKPSRLVPILRAQRHEAVDPARVAAEQARSWAQAREEFARAVPDGGRRAALSRLIDLVRTYLSLRENQRFTMERLQWELKRALRAVGRALHERGALDDVEDLWWCAWPELRASIQDNSPDLRAVVVERRARREADGRSDPPVFLREREPAELPARASRLRGQGVSAGRVRGVARLVRGPSDAARLQPGEILVAPAIDPGWTPLLAVASGVVLELGSRLSHGAVVAREYRIPAVANVEGALTVLHDGQEITVDGTRGLVFVHDRTG